MRRIVDGRLYDTNEATTLVRWSGNFEVAGIPVEVKYELCRRKVAKGDDPAAQLKVSEYGYVSDYNVATDPGRGEFFLAVSIGNGYDDNLGRVQPLTDTEARQLFERHSGGYGVADEYRKYFGVDPLAADPYVQMKTLFSKGVEAERERAKKAREAEAAARKAASDLDPED